MSAPAMPAPAGRRSPGPDASGRLVPLEEALERMLEGVEPLAAEEAALDVPDELLGGVTVEDVTALVTMPPWDDSAMDGFAVRADDVSRASAAAPIRLRVLGEAAAGRPSVAVVEPGTTVRILTGAPVPAGADAVVPVELTDAPRGMAELPAAVAVQASVATGAHIRPSGSDIAAGATLLRRGTPIAARHVGVLVAAGHATVRLHRRPRVAVVSTGDELTEPGTPLGPGRIHDSNGPSLAAQVVSAGGRLVSVTRVRDDLAEVTRSLRAAGARADLVVVSGGVSVGAHDVVKEAFEQVGRIDLWRVAVQPGRPLAFGRVTRPGDGSTLLFGLPGNPVSSFVTFELFVRPVLRRLAGRRDHLARDVVTATLADDVTKSRDRRAFLRVTLEPAPEPDATEPWLARLAGGQGSHVLSALAAADGLAVVPEAVDGLPAGSTVTVWRFERNAG